MKLVVALLALATVQVTLSAPLAKRAPSVNDVAPFGYAAMNGGTTGGCGATPVTVTTVSELTSAVAGNQQKIVMISGIITGNDAIQVGSNTTVIGEQGSSLVGVGLRVFRQSNVIIRNVKISKVLFATGDAIGIQQSSQVWVDHVDLSSDRDHDKDFYDGLLDITHGCTGITVTNSKLHDHWKASLIGHSDDNGAEDTKITVTMALNHWFNLNSRTPSFRFGHGHLFNNLFENNNNGINARDGAQLLVENNIWTGTQRPIYETDGGYAVIHGNDFGLAASTVPLGTFAISPYPCTLLPVSDLKSSVLANAGQTLSFSSY